MPTEGNGQPLFCKISIDGALAKELKLLRVRAKEAGVGGAYLDALQVAIFRMQNNPWGFGELVRRLKKSPWSIHVRCIRPLIIEFAISEEHPVVYIRRVQLLI